MKILIISTMKGFSWGGSEELWYQTACYAAAQGHDVTAVVFKNEPLHEKLLSFNEKGIRLYRIDELQIILYPFLKKVISKVSGKQLLIRHYDRYSFLHEMAADHILLNQGGAMDILSVPDLLRFMEHTTAKYSVLNQHHYEYGTINSALQETLRNVFKKAAHVFFVAKRNMEVIERQLAFAFQNAEAVKNPVNLAGQDFVTWPAEEIPAFATVARLDLNFKGQDILLQALSLQKWKERIFTLSLFGSGPDELHLQQLIHFYGLENKVFLKGHVKDVRKIWEGHHFLVLPSLSEGLPLSMVEAMLCGRPCLVTDAGDSATLIDESVNGWVSPVSSVKALDAALEKAWLQRKEWQEMGKKAAETAVRFTDKTPGKTLLEKMTDA